MPVDYDFSYNSFIKNIYLELPNGYQFKHQSYTDKDDIFLGRKKIAESFQDVLKSKNNRGAYLVTGYRGMGKTSFVNYALAPLEDKGYRTQDKRKVHIFRLSLAQSELKDVDILKHIVNQLIRQIESTRKYRLTQWFSLSNVFSLLMPLVMLGVINYNFESLPDPQSKDTAKTIIENLLGITSVSAIATFFIYKIADWFINKLVQLNYLGLGIIFLYIGALGVYSYLSNIPGPEWILANLLQATPVWVKEAINNDSGIFLWKISVVLFTLGFVIEFLIEVFRLETSKPSIKKIYERINLLYNRCNAQMTSEDQFKESFTASISSLFKRDVMIYPIANAKEIESELIVLIKDLKAHFQYIFVFDELDKVDPAAEPLSTADPNYEKRTQMNDLRERRHVITTILGSLKYFINEAEAKFIFIAGREMFEAALADISDRQSSVSSIFHRVIYVDSFLKDRSERETIASSIGILVEKRLSTLLLPSPQSTHSFSLTALLGQLKRFIHSLRSGSSQQRALLTDKWESDPNKDFFSNYYAYLTIYKKVSQEASRKIVFTLQNFLGYIVYRSNGSPKKVIRLLEEYIINKDNRYFDSERVKRRCIFLRSYHQPDSYYLYFSYYDQYKLGFTSYLFQPFLTRYSSYMKRFSDNTLVSTPYLIDNLIKFHPFAFSAQNLELIPEILSTNKSPISRPFLEELISFLGENHIRRTESGLFEYKFYDRTHNEITFISKIFEDEAAAFNFTLDENFAVKAHLALKIKLLRNAHQVTGDSKEANPISSIIFLNRLLGDVYFQDEEYEDAIVAYQDAIQMLNLEKLTISNYLITFIRLKMKLGLAYEKIKAYEFALGHYAGVIEEGGINMSNHAKKHEVIYRELLMLVMQAYSATLYLQEKLPEGITFQKIKHTVQGFHTLFEGFKLEYLNRDILLATFYSNIGTALYYKNMVLPQKVNEKRVDALTKGKDKHDMNFIEKFLRKNFFDNTTQTLAFESIVHCFPPTFPAEFIIKSTQELRSIENPRRIHSDARVSLTTYIYYKQTLKTLLGTESNNLADILIDCPKLIHARNDGEISFRSLQHNRRLTSIGHALAKLGDYLLPIIRQKENVVNDILLYFYDEPRSPTEPQIRNRLLDEYFSSATSKNNVFTDLKSEISPRLIIHIYYLASQFYLDAAETANGAFQLRKIIFTLRSVKLSHCPIKKVPIITVLQCLEFNLIKRILELSSWMSHSSDRPQLSKAKQYFNINTLRTPHTISSELYGNLSNNPDTKETILAYALLKSRYKEIDDQGTGPMDLFASFKSISEYKLLSPYGSIAHHIIRMMELELHTSLNLKILYSSIEANLAQLINDYNKKWPLNPIAFTLAGAKSSAPQLDNWDRTYFHVCKLYDIDSGQFPGQPSANPANPDRDKFVTIIQAFTLMAAENPGNFTPWIKSYAELVINSIFNLTQIDRIINTYGINYILSYSYIGQVHHYLGNWLKHLYLCRILIKQCRVEFELDLILKELIGNQLNFSLDALTSYQVAIQYYYKAIQMHKEGGSYRHQINNLIYLEDDYNDNLYHFGAALERLRINSKSIRNKIDYLKTELKTANMYKYSTFIGEEQ